VKTCIKCGITKELTDFYKHAMMADGRLGKCKECCKQDTKANYRKNLEHYIAYDASRAQTAERKERVRKYHSTHRPLVNEIKYKWIARNPEKRAAHKAVEKAVRNGSLKRLPCRVCGSLNSQAHHPDYSKPLDVEWRCRKHHIRF
jgi:hypothetical protein